MKLEDPHRQTEDLCSDQQLQMRPLLDVMINWSVWEEIEALQEVLEKLKSKRGPQYEKKFGQVPMCDAGEQCAVRKGARIGKLCDCPRGTSCNSFLLKCL
ncbi:cocaine- and amphetamine-regulated transcript protein isoform X2 [Vidua macroura]|uniref:cocaine- and amphetamine-regulated transcript protein isoform X2 n=1 Tax=Vidua macroura TaxID=187451 RepID=UPI0023A846CA|nr:cocaine- and amphetamine-regulated transcript protein isoform X2 [Vidua macroura]